ncbi:copper resistance CopC family protein [Saccharothrix deserti]|uniref:copper resistance CopC family protein n=1 Tax=Saccharothrix deserti TaxID=2593674 RepID=UPI00131D7717|nr:copper resistance CopC family protein [Saccharothrix deserti]
MTRLALSALLATLALFGAAPQALAHTELISSDPANGASVPQRPTQLTLTFTEPVPAESAAVTVTGPDGSAWPLGEVAAQGATLTVPMRESGSPAGRYTVAWTVEALDGDFVNGTFAFTLTAPPVAQQPPAATPTPTAPAVTSADAAPTTGSSTASVATITLEITAPSTPAATGSVDDDGGLPLWVWILIAAVLSLAAVTVIVGLGRRASGSDSGDSADTEGTGGAEKPAE